MAWNINDLIQHGMDFFTGKTVLKSTLDAAEAKGKETQDLLTAANSRIAELEKSDAASKTALTAAQSEITTLKAANEADKATVTTAQARIAELEKAAKSVSQTAQQITAAQGVPAAQLPATGTSAGAAQTEAQLLEQFNAIKDPKERGEFYAKHFAPKFNKKD